MSFLRRAYGSMGDEPTDEAEVRGGLSRAGAAAEKLIADIRMFEADNAQSHKEIDAIASMIGVRIKVGSPGQRLKSLRSEIESRLKRR